jgi:hypothetical protein
MTRSYGVLMGVFCVLGLSGAAACSSASSGAGDGGKSADGGIDASDGKSGPMPPVVMGALSTPECISGMCFLSCNNGGSPCGTLGQQCSGSCADEGQYCCPDNNYYHCCGNNYCGLSADSCNQIPSVDSGGPTGNQDGGGGPCCCDIRGLCSTTATPVMCDCVTDQADCASYCAAYNFPVAVTDSCSAITSPCCYKYSTTGQCICYDSAALTTCGTSCADEVQSADEMPVKECP